MRKWFAELYSVAENSKKEKHAVNSMSKRATMDQFECCYVLEREPQYVHLNYQKSYSKHPCLS